jgi:hypothetical protein
MDAARQGLGRRIGPRKRTELNIWADFISQAPNSMPALPLSIFQNHDTFRLTHLKQ